MTTFYIEFKHVLHTFLYNKKGKENLIIIGEPKGQISSYFSLFLLNWKKKYSFTNQTIFLQASAITDRLPG